MSNIFDLIWPKDNSRKVADYSNQEWLSIINHLLHELSIFLGSDFDCTHPIDQFIRKGFSINIQSRGSALGPLSVTWKGILGGGAFDNYVYVSTTLFLYINKKKVVTKSGESLI